MERFSNKEEEGEYQLGSGFVVKGKDKEIGEETRVEFCEGYRGR